MFPARDRSGKSPKKVRPVVPKMRMPPFGGSQPSHLGQQHEQSNGNNGAGPHPSPPGRGWQPPSTHGGASRTGARSHAVESQSHLSSHDNFDLLTGYNNLIWFANNTDDDGEGDPIPVADEATPESSDGDIIDDMDQTFLAARGWTH